MRKIGSILIVFVLLLATSISAFAGTVTSYWGSYSKYTAGSYTVRHASYVLNCNAIQGRTIIKNNAGSAMPAGTIGVNAMLVGSNGKSISSGWSFSTDDTTVGLDYYVDKPSTWAGGNVYSWGFTGVWNGTSYTQKQTSKSPTCTTTGTVSSKSISSNSVYTVKTNESNQTYGSILSAKTLEQVPDLISAVGIDGSDGYIKKNDVFAMPSSPEEAVKMELARRATKEDKTIPLYDTDGKTVNGHFVIKYSEPTEYKVDNK